MKVLLLGVGMQGETALHDLVHSESVSGIVAADLQLEKLTAHVGRMGYGNSVRCEYLDASDPETLDRLMQQAPDVAIDLLPVPFIGTVAAAAIKHRIPLVNTYYVVPELRELAARARERGVTILPEFGLDPGIDLVLLGQAARSFDEIEELKTYGAGIPEAEAADNPLKYKISWTFEGVLGIYRRGGRIIRDGAVIDIEGSAAFSPENIHEVEVAGVGLLEAFPNGDAVEYVEALGLAGAKLRKAARYTMRWPGHCALWKSLVDLHLLDREPVVVQGVQVDRERYLAAALGPHLQYGSEERDLAIVRVEIIGTKAGKRTSVLHEVIDRRDRETGFLAMSRTVGFTASIGAQLVASRVITGPGLLSPLTDVPYERFIQELAKRGIRVRSTAEALE